MNRVRRNSKWTFSRVPRVSGDEPRQVAKTVVAQKSSPRKRGWTVQLDNGPRRLREFPASGDEPTDWCWKSNSYASSLRKRGRTDGLGHRSSRCQRVPHKRGWTVDSAIIQEDLRFFPHYVIGGVDRKNNFFFPFTAELYTYMEVNRNDGFFNGLISSTRWTVVTYCLRYCCWKSFCEKSRNW